jgi:glycogen operon protein
LGPLAARLAGSPDIFGQRGRPPQATINYVTAHDGFTLTDLVSYEKKHNLENGENNRDGHNDNRSWNCGEEGPAGDPAIRELRNRLKRNFLATLLLSQGIPMILSGDELGRTQQGNNNAYCQDNDLSWLQWESADEALIAYTRRLIDLRRRHPAFRRRKWLRTESGGAAEKPDVRWYRPDGAPMAGGDWSNGYAKSIQGFLSGEIGYRDLQGEPVADDDFLLLFNAHGDEVTFRLPPDLGEGWQVVLDTRNGEVPPAPYHAGGMVQVVGHGMVVLQRAR